MMLALTVTSSRDPCEGPRRVCFQLILIPGVRFWHSLGSSLLPFTRRLIAKQKVVELSRGCEKAERWLVGFDEGLVWEAKSERQGFQRCAEGLF